MARVLIVDDSLVMRRNLKVILNQAGHEVVGESKNGKQAYMDYINLKPDIVTMDITMPVMNGIEAVKKIVGSHPEAKIIMISALAQKKMVYEALENGAQNYILKPITTEKVLTTIEKVLGDEEIHIEKQQLKKFEELHEKRKKFEYMMGTGSGLAVENVGGIFEIYISRTFNDQWLEELIQTIRGLLIIKPLHVKFYFDDVPKMPEDLLVPIRSVMDQVKEAGGEVEGLALNEDFKKRDALRGPNRKVIF